MSENLDDRPTSSAPLSDDELARAIALGFELANLDALMKLKRKAVAAEISRARPMSRQREDNVDKDERARVAEPEGGGRRAAMPDGPAALRPEPDSKPERADTTAPPEIIGNPAPTNKGGEDLGAGSGLRIGRTK